MAEKHSKKYSTSLIIKDVQTKLPCDFFVHQLECPRLIKQITVHADKNVSKGNTHPLLMGGQT